MASRIQHDTLHGIRRTKNLSMEQNSIFRNDRPGIFSIHYDDWLLKHPKPIKKLFLSQNNMKCDLCGNEIKQHFLGKIKGTYVEVQGTEKKICNECQSDKDIDDIIEQLS